MYPNTTTKTINGNKSKILVPSDEVIKNCINLLSPSYHSYSNYVSVSFIFV